MRAKNWINLDLYNAIIVYTKEALEKLQQAFPKGPTDEIIAAENDRARFSRFPFGPWRLLLLDTATERHKLASYEKCRRTLREDPQIARQLDNSVGTPLTQWGRQEEQLIDHVLGKLPLEENRYSITQAEIDDAYATLEDEFFCENIKVEVIAPLAGLSVHQPVQLEKTLMLRQLTRTEMDPFRLMEIEGNRVGQNSGVVAQYELPFIVGEPDEASRQKAMVQRESAKTAIERVVWLLTLMFGMDVGCRATCEITNPSVGGAFQFWAGSHKLLYRHNHLSNESSQEIRRLWSDCREGNVWGRPSLDTAIRRFTYGLERLRQDDAIVDLVIAAEAMLLESVDDPQYRGEIKYRFCLNGALCAKAIGVDPITAHRLLAKAYDIRSRLVHGGPNRKIQDDGALHASVAAMTALLRPILLESI